MQIVVFISLLSFFCFFKSFGNQPSSKKSFGTMIFCLKYFILSTGGVMILVENKQPTNLFWKLSFRSFTTISLSMVDIHDLSLTFGLFIIYRLWCVYSVPVRQHCFSLYVTKLGSATQSFLESLPIMLFYAYYFTDLLVIMQTPLENLEPILREDIQKVTYYFLLFCEFFILLFHIPQ